MTGRGQNRGRIMADRSDARHWLWLVGEMRERYRVRVAAYCLMSNHYHLLVGTPEANLSRAMQWLNVSYSAWYNRRHGQVGHLFQGRFGAVLVEGAYELEVSIYIHLNPVGMTALGLGKRQKAAEGRGLMGRPSAEVLRARVEALRRFPWSSYRGYAGYERPEPWLDRERLLKRVKDGAKGYRKLVEGRILQEQEEDLGSRVRWGVVLGGERFARKVRGVIRVSRETAGREALRARRPVEEIVRMVEGIRGERKNRFWDRHGDWGRDLVLWGARRYGGLTLAELGALAGGVDYTAVSMALKRLAGRALRDRSLRTALKILKDKCEK